MHTWLRYTLLMLSVSTQGKTRQRRQSTSHKGHPGRRRNRPYAGERTASVGMFVLDGGASNSLSASTERGAKRERRKKVSCSCKSSIASARRTAGLIPSPSNPRSWFSHYCRCAREKGVGKLAASEVQGERASCSRPYIAPHVQRQRF
ncbi:hypothetical protein BJY59DRAFT_327880 [Rhodotorula toruloides]